MARIPLEPLPAEESARAKPGARGTRSDTVTVRLDPRLNYLCELAARAQRRSKSSFIEWAVERALKDVPVPGTREEWGKDDLSVEGLANDLWDVYEPDRLVALAFKAPILLTHEEQLIWKVIKEYGHVWLGRYSKFTKTTEKWSWQVVPGNIVMEEVRRQYDNIKRVALEGASTDILPMYTNTKKIEPSWAEKAPESASIERPEAPAKTGSGFNDDLDDDIPF